MDEPFAALDSLSRRTMQEELLRLWEQISFTMLFVTHSIEEAILLGSRVLVLSSHPGRVRAELNAHQFGFADLDTPEFAALQRRISDMLSQKSIGVG
jgi:NitT/TauT family transport system ATP-binding protein